MTRALGLLAVGLPSVTVVGQSRQPRPPVIDMHVHANAMYPPERTMAMFDSLNVRYIFLSTRPDTSGPWASVDATRFLPALAFPCIRGKTLFADTCVFEKSGVESPDITWLRAQLKAERFHALGEVVSQYAGIFPTDSRMEPYWALAEEFDVPVGIHMGPAGPGRGIPMAVGDPLLLEDVLLRHKRLRVFVMDAGWPRLESMTALMYSHANVFVDVAALQIEMESRAAYMRHLRGLVEAGFGKRIMFGSDFPAPGGPQAADYPREGIDAILTAEFLTAEQKADILCGNAARFLRLDAAVCRP
jgi:hypothetical protein